MKVAEPSKKNATSAKSDQPFFQRGGHSLFSHDNSSEHNFFEGRRIATKKIQAKLSVGQPNDKYEKEADSMADRVVQRLQQPDLTDTKNADTRTASSSTHMLQTKCAECDREEKVQKVEESEPAPKQVKQSEPFVPAVQTKCAECANEEKIQKEEEKEQQPVEKRLMRKADDMPSDDDGEGEDESKMDEKCGPKKKVQKKGDAGKGNLNYVEGNLTSSKGGGSPMSASVKGNMEQAFGNDFSDVRIHTDSRAVQMSKDLGAHAFTHGNDVYFNSGKYAPDTRMGQHLLAHELTHTVQQGNNLKRSIIQKAGKKTSPNTSNTNTGSSPSTTPVAQPDVPEMVSGNTYRGLHGIIDKDKKSIDLPLLNVPDFKEEFIPSSNLIIRRGRAAGTKRETSQIDTWEKNAKQSDTLSAKLDDKIKNAYAFGTTDRPVVFFSVGNNMDRILVGSKADILKRVLRPYWTVEGKMVLFEVDHKLEHQLCGVDSITESIKNMWLLEKVANGSSGRNIFCKVKETVNLVLDDSAKAKFWGGNDAPDFDDVRRDYTISYSKVAYNLPYDSIGAKPNPLRYTLDDIQKGKQLEPLKPLKKEEVAKAGLAGDASHFTIYKNSLGGKYYTLEVPTAAAKEVPFKKMDKTTNKFIPGFEPTVAIFTPDNDVVAKIRGELFAKDPSKTLVGHGMTTELEVKKLNGLPNAGIMNFDRIRKQIVELFGSGNVKARWLSPIKITDAGIDEEGSLYASGKIVTDVPVIDGADIDILIKGDDVSVQKTFTAKEIKLPPPIKVPESSLTVEISSQSGFKISGEANLEIPNVAKGKISAMAQSGTGGNAGFAVEGKLDFDQKTFKPASIEVKYDNHNLTIGGTLGIPKGKIKGVNSATIEVKYDSATKLLIASGNADFDIPGIKKGKLNVTYGDGQFNIEGEAELQHKLIKSGNVKAKIAKKGEQYDFFLSGTAKPNIPHVETDLAVDYVNGEFTISGTVAYSKGRLSGLATIGVTNRQVGTDGKPVPGATGKDLVAFGGGQLTLKITDWLQGTAGVKLMPDGNLEVMGKLGIPDVVNIFPRKEINKELFKAPTIEIPLFAIPLGPRSIGLVATIGGGLDGYAGIGPAQLTNASIEAKYNTARENDLQVTGSAKFRIPADAGLRLHARLGIGVSIAIARVTGGIEIGGSLGIESAAEAAIQINWTPSQGIKLDSEISVSAQPKFKFDVNAGIEASLDLYFTSLSKEWKKTLYSFEFGPSLKFGAKLPIHYEEKKPFSISLNDIQFEKPDINIADLSKDIGKKIFDDVIN